MKLSEEEIRKIALTIIEELGEKATPELTKTAVRKAVEKIESQSEDSTRTIVAQENKTSGRLILTSYGINKSGIVSAITTRLSELNCDIQDITQKILAEFYTLIMIVDFTSSPKNFHEIQEAMSEVADRLGVKIHVQHEDIFKYMHRI